MLCALTSLKRAKAPNPMTLPLLLTTLLLSASPALADDLLYLKCNTTIKYNQIKPYPQEGEEDLVLYYEIDFKNKMATDLALALNGEGSFEMKVENGLILIKEEVYDEEGTLTISRQTEISYDPPGRIVGLDFANDLEDNNVGTADLEGSCESSNKSSIEKELLELLEYERLMSVACS